MRHVNVLHKSHSMGSVMLSLLACVFFVIGWRDLSGHLVLSCEAFIECDHCRSRGYEVICTLTTTMSSFHMPYPLVIWKMSYEFAIFFAYLEKQAIHKACIYTHDILVSVCSTAIIIDFVLLKFDKVLGMEIASKQISDCFLVGTLRSQARGTIKSHVCR